MITNGDALANCFCLSGGELTYLNPQAPVGPNLDPQINWSCNDLSNIYPVGVVPALPSMGTGAGLFPAPAHPNAIYVRLHLQTVAATPDWDMTAWSRFAGLILSVDVPVEIKYP